MLAEGSVATGLYAVGFHVDRRVCILFCCVSEVWSSVERFARLRERSTGVMMEIQSKVLFTLIRVSEGDGTWNLTSIAKRFTRAGFAANFI